MHTFKMSAIKQVCQLIQQGDYAFSIDLKDTYLHISIVKCHSFLHFVWQNKPYQWKVVQLVFAMAPTVFTYLTKSNLLLC